MQRINGMAKTGLIILTLLAWSVDVQAQIPSITNHLLPGDGATPTFLQYMDTQKITAREASHLANASPKGPVIYNFSIPLPPAIFKPDLSLNYSSDAGPNIEMPGSGWSLGGIPEISRPLTKAFKIKDKADWCDAEWTVSGGGFSGTLKPSSSSGDCHFYLKTAGSSYVVADYNKSANAWTLTADTVTTTLAATDRGADTEAGTARWRASESKDAAGNVVNYCYDSDGRVTSIGYGGNEESGDDPLINVAFAYGDNTVERTSYRAGFKVDYEKHIEKITIQSGWSGSCGNGGTALQFEFPFLQNAIAAKVQSTGASAASTTSLKNAPVMEKSSSTVKSDSVSKPSSVLSSTVKDKGSALKNTAGNSLIGRSCIVDTDDAEDETNRLYAIDIVTSTEDDIDFLTTLEHEGLTSCDAEKIAEFDYTEYDDKSSGTGTAPATLGYAMYEDDKSAFTAWSQTAKSLMDANRDGLPDVIDTTDAKDTEKWKITSQGVDHDKRTFSWNSTKEIETVEQPLDYTETEKDTSSSAPAYNESCTTVQTLDFDGDGYLDVVVAGDPDAWTVYYGTGNVDGDVSQRVTSRYLIAAISGGSAVESMVKDYATDAIKSTSGFSLSNGYFYAVTEVPPQDSDWTCIRKNWRLKAEHDDADTITTDQLYGALDVNGDGFLDLLRPAEGKLWKHTGKRGGGWEEVTSLSNNFTAMRRVNYTIDVEPFDIGCEEMCSKMAEMSSPAIYQNSEGDMGCANSISGCSDGFDDLAYSECMSACSGNQTYSIVHTDETGGFYDLNGDGLLDYVSSTSTPWRVYFGTGYDIGGSASDGESVSWQSPVPYSQRVDEGTAYKDWEDQSFSYGSHVNGTPTRLYQSLLDVNGDGLVDLVLGDRVDIDGDGRIDSNENSQSRVWYLNTGAGFDLTARELPDWWPGEFTSSYSTSDVRNDEESGVGATTTAKQMMDINHDGILDYVSVAWHYDYEEGEADAGTNEVKYGSYPRPHLLKEITNGQGGKTAMSYRSLATVAPSGNWGETQKTPNVMHLADTISSTDPLTGESAETLFDYANGEFDDGVWEGFAQRSVTREINSNWTSRTDYEYELSPYYDPLPTVTKLYTDFNLSFGDTIKKGSAKEGLRYKLEDDYDNFGSEDQFRLVATRKITEYGESSTSAISILGSTGKTSTLTFDWDDRGNMKEYVHDGGGNSDDAITVTMTYVTDAEGIISRMSQKTVSGFDPLTGSSRNISVESYYFDGHEDLDTPLTKGWLTRTATQSGWVGGGEGLDSSNYAISYERGERGELTKATDEASGIWVQQSFGFGGAVLETQTNALGQTIRNEIDSQGRVTKTTDPNGLSLSMTYDAFGRVTKKTVTGKNGTTKTLQSNSFIRSGAPYYDIIKYYDDSGSVDETNYVIQDGFARATQTWKQNDDGEYLVSTEIFDLRGLSTTVSHPENKGTAFSKPASFAITKQLEIKAYDALGKLREIERDAAKRTGAQLIYFDSPRTEIHQDEEGYQDRLTYDAHGRVIRVEQGKSDSYTTTAEYDYDPNGKLVAFRDGAGVCYAYSYDGAGRLRRVLHGRAETSTAANSLSQDNGLLAWILDLMSNPLRAAKTAPTTAKTTVKSAAQTSVSTKSSTAQNKTTSSTASAVKDTLKTGAVTSPSSTVQTGSGGKSLSVTDSGKSLAGAGAVSVKSLQSGFSTSSASKSLADCSATTPWVNYEYKGMLKTKMLDATGLYTSWTYDSIGRPTQVTASDALPGATGDLNYTFDYDDAWIGNVNKTTDSAGTITHSFDEFGRVNASTREFAATAANTSGKTASFSYEHDIRGREISKTLPSLRVLTSSYDYGQLKSLSASNSGTTDYTLTFDYNKYLQWTSATSSLGHVFTRTFTTPLWPDEIAMTAKSKTYTRGYDWLDNGLLSRRTNGTASSKSTSTTSSSKIITSSFKSGSSTKSSGVSIGTKYDYAYDSLKQIVALTSAKSGSTATSTSIEAYAFDSAGNPTAMTDASGASWTYDASGILNQIASRTSSSGATENFSYDAMGRLTEWRSALGTYNYYYDGMQRLRGVTLNGTWQEVLDYDADGNLARRGDNNPYETSSPYYLLQFREWRADEKTGIVTEEDHPLVVTENGARKWFLREHDGHAALTFDDAGTNTDSRVMGAFGATISASGNPWAKASFHGSEEKNVLFHMGQRHLLKNDGMFLQPEPLVYLGIPEKSLAQPLSLATRRYSMNAPTAFADTTGFDPDSLPTSDAETGVDSVTGLDNSQFSGEIQVVSTGQDTYSVQDASEDLANGEDPQDVKDKLAETAADATNNPYNVACVNNALARDSALRGTGAVPGAFEAAGSSAMPIMVQSGNGMVAMDSDIIDMQAQTGVSFKQVSVKELRPMMREADTGSGSTAIVVGVPPAGSSDPAHAFNLASYGGNVQVFGLSGSASYGTYLIMMTSGGNGQ